MTLLHIDAGITGNASVSRQISTAVVTALREADPSLRVVRRDLDADPVPHLDSRELAALGEPDNALVEEFLAADTIVIGAPMYNFSIPSQLKAWFDHVLVNGKTFRYTVEGPQGLAGGKRVIVASARGGFYGAGTPHAAADFQEPYLRTLFGFAGIDDVTFVRAEGVAISPDHRQTALESALAQAKAPALAKAA